MRIHGRSLTDGSIDAMLAVNLPGTVDPGELPAEIQYMPPGQHTIEASRGGKPVKLDVTVNAAGADRVAQAHANFLAGAEQGTEDIPYFDFNHADEEASAHPTAFYWGGDDPQRGGIRAKVNWTSRGREAVNGRTYRRFSPSFYVDKNNGEISGAPVNMGALVNRAAFKRIQPIIAKHVELQEISGPKTFLDKVKVVAKARNLETADAINVLARERPDLYDKYRFQLGLGSTRERQDPRKVNAVWTAFERDELMLEARALSDALDIDIISAASQICLARPTLYERYRARLRGVDLDKETIAAVHARAQESPFFAKSKAVASARGIDISDAFLIVARENPELYDNHRKEFYG